MERRCLRAEAERFWSLSVTRICTTWKRTVIGTENSKIAHFAYVVETANVDYSSGQVQSMKRFGHWGATNEFFALRRFHKAVWLPVFFFGGRLLGLGMNWDAARRGSKLWNNIVVGGRKRGRAAVPFQVFFVDDEAQGRVGGSGNLKNVEVCKISFEIYLNWTEFGSLPICSVAQSYPCFSGTSKKVCNYLEYYQFFAETGLAKILK